ncbi:hypothetical protein [Sphingomonas crocodyli]|uniref:Uncharacterized protein n=1 Tax=Sphingomonas crocodyli TaxID=1979270 RepID=A0A437LXX1_9SPHN|nr:hypothetical protein [Sphingomonas crocodyli]RVT90173.1 hypothetical protein EOD43_17875 [Sphingomonas crocodyli]
MAFPKLRSMLTEEQNVRVMPRLAGADDRAMPSPARELQGRILPTLDIEPTVQKYPRVVRVALLVTIPTAMWALIFRAVGIL